VWRDGVEVVAMDGFTGFKTAATEELPDAVAVIVPSMSCAWPVTPSTSVAAGSSSTPAVAVAVTAPALRRPPDLAHRRRPAHRQAATPAGEAVRRR
jgi:hypothetical protein